MADNKRHSIAGKVATPKTAPVGNAASQTIPNTWDTLTKSIGARIKLTTAAPQSHTLEGILFTADPVINVVVINTYVTPANTVATAASPGDYHVIPVSCIQTFSVLPGADNGKSGNASTLFQIGAVDIEQAKAREEARVAKLKEEERHRGKGVTREAQAIYDSFKRINMPIRWHNQEMIVHEAVIIAPPYRVEDCKGAKEKQEVLNRVRKVLEGERKKLKEREERNGRTAPAPAPTGGLRKGG